MRRAAAAATLICGSAFAAPPYPEGARPAAWFAPEEAPRLVIDGRLDEPAWREAPRHEAFVQYLPIDRQPAPGGYRTTVQIVVERQALVFGIRAYDPRPGEIRAELTRRDQVRRDQDFVAVYLDAVGARRAAQFVRVNAAGVVTDGVHRAADDSEDTAPDFELDAAAQRDTLGWSVELRIPLIELRYPRDGSAPWRAMVARSIPRDSSTLLVSAPLDKEALHFLAELQPIDGGADVAERARASTLLLVQPELTLRGTREREADAPFRRERRASLGVDLKWRPRADWVFDATLNPDFSQVELDVPQLAGNTRFALSVPEKRPFFLESTDVIDLPIAAFYSRSVTDPQWGLRATWRGAGADATALSLRDEGGGLLLRPGPYATAVRTQDARAQASMARGRWRSDASTTGVVAALRDDAAGGSNRVLGADWRWHPGDSRQLTLRALGSQTVDAAGAPREDGHHLHAHWRARIPGWNFDVKATEISPRFRNDNGFVDQAGVRFFEAEILRRYGETALPGFTAHEFEFYLWTMGKTALADAGVRGGETVARLVHPGLWLIADRNTEAWAQLKLDAERARPGGRLHETPGVAAGWSANPAPWLTRAAVEVGAGRLLDVEADRTGRGVQWEAELVLRGTLPGGWGIESEQRLEEVWVDAPDGARAFSDRAARWLGVLHFGPRDALRVVWQRSRFERRADASIGLAADRAQERSLSFVYQRRLGLGRSLAVGASRQRRDPAGWRADEVFAKVSFVL